MFSYAEDTILYANIHVHPCESKIPPALNLNAYFLRFIQFFFLIFTDQTGAWILIYYTGKSTTEIYLNCLRKNS